LIRNILSSDIAATGLTPLSTSAKIVNASQNSVAANASNTLISQATAAGQAQSTGQTFVTWGADIEHLIQDITTPIGNIASDVVYGALGLAIVGAAVYFYYTKKA
jgi:hypothetical protein